LGLSSCWCPWLCCCPCLCCCCCPCTLGASLPACSGPLSPPCSPLLPLPSPAHRPPTPLVPPPPSLFPTLHESPSMSLLSGRGPLCPEDPSVRATAPPGPAPGAHPLARAPPASLAWAHQTGPSRGGTRPLVRAVGGQNPPPPPSGAQWGTAAAPGGATLPVPGAALAPHPSPLARPAPTQGKGTPPRPGGIMAPGGWKGASHPGAYRRTPRGHAPRVRPIVGSHCPCTQVGRTRTGGARREAGGR